MRKDRYRFKGISTIDDVKEFESKGFDSHNVPQNSYSVIRQSFLDNQNELALSYFTLIDDYKKPFTYTYAELFAKVNQTANLINSIG
ncbi:MAG: hypothetical protein COB65_13640, partial [Thalassobium sp.]